MPSNEGTTYVAPWRVLIVGGSYAGLATATNLLDLSEGRLPRFNPTLERDTTLGYRAPVEINIVDERDGYYHLIGSPLALADDAYAEKAWVKFEDLKALKHPAVKFIQGSVHSVDCDALTATIKLHDSNKSIQQNYDYLVAASGLRRPWPVVPQSLTRASYLQEACAHISATKSSTHGVVIIGGGAVGVEMAAELKMVQPTTKVTLIHSRDKLLSAEPLPDEFKTAIAPLVREAGVDSLVLNTRVTSITPSPEDPILHHLTLSDNTTLTASHVISAISSPVPTTTYLPHSALDAEGYVRIAPTLHFPSDLEETTSPEKARRHFAVGDIAAWSGIKRCGAAMHMGHYAAYNIHQQILFGDVVGSAPGSPVAASSSSGESSPTSSSSSSSSWGKMEAAGTGRAKFMKLEQFPNVIGLAVGKKAITYGPADGVKSGEEVENLMFGGDLGWGICWRYLRLGEEDPGVVVVGGGGGGDVERDDEVQKEEKREEVLHDGVEKLALEEVEKVDVGGKGDGVSESVAVVASAA